MAAGEDRGEEEEDSGTSSSSEEDAFIVGASGRRPDLCTGDGESRGGGLGGFAWSDTEGRSSDGTNGGDICLARVGVVAFESIGSTTAEGT